MRVKFTAKSTVVDAQAFLMGDCNLNGHGCEKGTKRHQCPKCVEDFNKAVDAVKPKATAEPKKTETKPKATPKKKK